jgi:nitroreductase
MMDVFDAIEKRASIRSFKNEQITESELQAILRAAERAPRIGSLDILVLQDKQKIRQISDAAKRAMIESGGWNSMRAKTPGYQPLYEAPSHHDVRQS